MKSAVLLFVAVLAVVQSDVQAQLTHTIVAAPGTWNYGPGQTTSAWMYNGTMPGPLLRGTEGQTMHVRFVNQTSEPSSIHFHGLPVPLGQDGVPFISRPAVEPGQEYNYELLLSRPGTYFYHSHFGHQLDRGLHGLLIVDPATPIDAAYDKEIIIDIDDLLPGAPINGQDPIYADYLINGMNSGGQTPHFVDPGDVVRVRFINSSSFTTYVVAIDGHQLEVTHADGRKVQSVFVDGIPLGPGERYDAYFTASNPGSWSIAAASILNPGLTLVRAILGYNGTPLVTPPASTAPFGLFSPNRLNYDQLASAEAVMPIQPVADVTHSLDLSFNPINYTFFIGGQSFPTASTVNVQHGDEVRFSMLNFTGQYHPMHLHGHFFRLHTLAGGQNNAPLRDTILMPPASMSGIPSANLDFTADAPGQWVFHCHVIYHAEAGMVRVVTYVNGDQDADGLDDSFDLEPLDAHPVLTSDGMNGGFVPGALFSLDNQWPMGATTYFYYGLELPAPLPQGPVGLLRLHSPFLLGSAASGVSDVASLPVLIPPVPALSGFRAAFQALTIDAALTPPYRLSTSTIVSVN